MKSSNSKDGKQVSFSDKEEIIGRSDDQKISTVVSEKIRARKNTEDYLIDLNPAQRTLFGDLEKFSKREGLSDADLYLSGLLKENCKNYASLMVDAGHDVSATFNTIESMLLTKGDDSFSPSDVSRFFAKLAKSTGKADLKSYVEHVRAGTSVSDPVVEKQPLTAQQAFFQSILEKNLENTAHSPKTVMIDNFEGRKKSFVEEHNDRKAASKINSNSPQINSL